jgi:hypothetical protein
MSDRVWDSSDITIDGIDGGTGCRSRGTGTVSADRTGARGVAIRSLAHRERPSIDVQFCEESVGTPDGAIFLDQTVPGLCGEENGSERKIRTARFERHGNCRNPSVETKPTGRSFGDRMRLDSQDVPVVPISNGSPIQFYSDPIGSLAYRRERVSR